MTETDANRKAGLLLQTLRDLATESRLPVPQGGITLDTRLEADLGLDSLGRSELISRVEQALGFVMPEEALLAPTARDLLNLAEAKKPAGVLDPHDVSPPAAAEGGGPEGALTLIEALNWHLQHHPDRTHILYYGSDENPEPISYAALHQSAVRVAGRLRRAGLVEGERVAVMLPTSPEYFASFFGILAAGAIPVPIYPPARPQQIEDHLLRHARILDNAGAAFLITVAAARTVARLLRAQVPSLRDVLTLEDLATEAPIPDSVRPDAQDVAFLQYTSGSTGNPKGVILTHANLLANIRAMGEAVQVRPDDRFVSWLPLYHDMGLIGAWLGSLYYGIPLVSLSPLAFLARPLRWLQTIHRHRGTLSAAPNFAYELCLTRIPDAALKELDLGSWRWAFNGAEPVSPQTLRRFAERFAPCGLRQEALAPVYGLAEAAVGLAFPPLDRGPRIDCIDRRRFSRSGHALQVPSDDPSAMEVVGCGRPLPGYRVRVVSGEGDELPERHEGMLQFQGPSATQGYFRNPEATARLIRDGWHETGDRAYLAGGDIHLTGRVKDLIIRGGRNIYPYELEQAVGELAGIRKGCVVAFAAADKRTGSERLVIVAETRERNPDQRTTLEQRVRERSTDILGMPPDEVVLAPPRAVLKTSSGKLRRVDVRDRYLAGTLTAAPRSAKQQLVRIGIRAVTSGLGRFIRRLPVLLYAAYAWILFALMAPIVWVGVMIAPRTALRWALVRGGIRWLRRLVFVRLSVRGKQHVPGPREVFVLAANHQSYLDALLLIEAVPRPLGFVAKRELADIPMVGRLLTRLDTRFVDRFDLHRGAAESGHFSDALKQGQVLAFFPEGTFREDAGLLPFRMGAFVAAAQAGVPVLPVALRGTRDLMGGESFLPRPGRVEVNIGQRCDPGGEDWEDAVTLRDSARMFIAARCGEADRGR